MQKMRLAISSMAILTLLFAATGSAAKSEAVIRLEQYHKRAEEARLSTKEYRVHAAGIAFQYPGTWGVSHRFDMFAPRQVRGARSTARSDTFALNQKEPKSNLYNAYLLYISTDPHFMTQDEDEIHNAVEVEFQGYEDFDNFETGTANIRGYEALMHEFTYTKKTDDMRAHIFDMEVRDLYVRLQYFSNETFFDRDYDDFIRLVHSIEYDGKDLFAPPEEKVAVTVQKSTTPKVTGNVFSDVPAHHSHVSAIQWAKSSGVLQGYPDGTFQPDKTLNRAEMVKILLEAAGIPPVTSGSSGFSDVDEYSWYAPYVRAAVQRGIVGGYPDRTFRPNNTVNYAEALKIAYGALGVSTQDTEGAWFDRYLSHARRHSILFAEPRAMDEGMSRKDVVWIVWKLQQQGQRSVPTVKEIPTSTHTFSDTYPELEDGYSDLHKRWKALEDRYEEEEDSYHGILSKYGYSVENPNFSSITTAQDNVKGNLHALGEYVRTIEDARDEARRKKLTNTQLTAGLHAIDEGERIAEALEQTLTHRLSLGYLQFLYEAQREVILTMTRKQDKKLSGNILDQMLVKIVDLQAMLKESDSRKLTTDELEDIGELVDDALRLYENSLR